MSPQTAAALAQAGGIAAMALGAVGSGLGAGVAGSAAVGAWKRCYLQKRPAPFQLAVFVGAPLSQTIYGMILMLLIRGKSALMLAPDAPAELIQRWPFLLVGGIMAGLGLGVSAWMQGVAAAGCCDAYSEVNKGFTNDLMVLGIIETVALFTMVFTIVML